MPVTHTDAYPGPPWYQFNGHLETVLPSFGGPSVDFRRERLELDDGDFLDLDWLAGPEAEALVILTHGLEGDSYRPYIRSAARFFRTRGWDALAWNCRSCSGEMNRLLRLYHHGEIEDIHAVLTHALRQKDYRRIVLIGYSMGGAMTTKYLSVHGDEVHPAILGGIAFSSPFDLAASVDALELPGNGVYKKRFLRQLSRKLRVKDQAFPGRLPMEKLKDVRHWRDFDEWFTTAILDVPDAAAFYELASAKNFLSTLARPVLAVCALNDPIITDDCLPLTEAAAHPYLHVELTERGGHVGYALPNRDHNWMDVRAWEEVERWMDGDSVPSARD